MSIEETIARHDFEERARRNAELTRLLEQTSPYEDVLSALACLKGLNVEERAAVHGA